MFGQSVFVYPERKKYYNAETHQLLVEWATLRENAVVVDRWGTARPALIWPSPLPPIAAFEGVRYVA